MIANQEHRNTRKEFQPTTEQKSQILEDVVYEMGMLLICLKLNSAAGQAIAGRFPNGVRNAVFESFLLHARGLLKFFETSKEKRTKDDVLAEDYDFSAAHVGIERAIRARLDKDLAHLTYSRLDRRTKETRQWKFRDFVPILERCCRFLEHIRCREQATRDDKLKTRISELLVEFGAFSSMVREGAISNIPREAGSCGPN